MSWRQWTTLHLLWGDKISERSFGILKKIKNRTHKCLKRAFWAKHWRSHGGGNEGNAPLFWLGLFVGFAQSSWEIGYLGNMGEENTRMCKEETTLFCSLETFLLKKLYVPLWAPITKSLLHHCSKSPTKLSKNPLNHPNQSPQKSWWHVKSISRKNPFNRKGQSQTTTWQTTAENTIKLVSKLIISVLLQNN